ncbi:hypothetical protein [Candidatus Venteria ishoeyi]|uniref:Uncharacterized protein n=1 Tax=Candidatus Venteria ishoeyi TaxID=1899563 RepID=A0A1H6F3Q1_9GAMM|nr:hypothetical protein [Candidatus Venteria ishoeyi]SEH04777.1 Uncharacterised protein [Candidatus Venteria ishoeyi]
MKKWLFLMVVAIYLQGIGLMSFAEIHFPSQIKYKMIIEGKHSGDIKMYCSPKIWPPGSYKIVMTDFAGFGIKSSEKMLAFIDGTTLSLHAAAIYQGSKVVDQVRLKQGGSPIDDSPVPLYVHIQDGVKTQTELGNNYLLIDILSAFIIASEKVRQKDKLAAMKKFNLFIRSRKSPIIVDMVSQVGQEKSLYNGKNVDTSVVSLMYHNQEMLKFNIYQENDKYFPVSVTMKDVHQSIEFRVTDYVQH